LIFTFVSIEAFDFQMPDDQQAAAPDEENDSPAPANKQKPRPNKLVKKASKAQSKAGRKAHKIKKAAKKKAAKAAAQPSITSVQEQIRRLNEKIDRLEAGQASTATPISSTPSNSHKDGYSHLAGTNTSFKIGDYVKVDGIYDANQYTGDSSNLPNLRLKGLDSDASRQNVFTAHAKQTRISLATETNSAHGQVMTYVESDFFGTQTNGSASGGSFSRSDTSSVNSYTFRIRHAYGSYCYNTTHRIDVGQMWTLFYDIRSGGTTIEFNGPETTAQIRRPQIRYTHTPNKSWKFSVSAESGATEYTDISPAFTGSVASGLTAGSPSTSYNSSQYRRAQSTFLGGISGDGNQSLPDLVAQTIYEKPNVGHISIGAMVRELKIKKVTSSGTNDPVFKGRKYGYGIALGGRWFFHGKSNIFGQMNFGKGIGTYIFALDGYGALVDVSRSIMRPQSAYGALIGIEVYWDDKVRSNFIFSQARAFVPSSVPTGRAPVIGVDATGNLATIATTGYSISRLLRQFYANLLWAPVAKFEIGIEYAYFRRNTVNNFFGYGNRFQLGAYYKF